MVVLLQTPVTDIPPVVGICIPVAVEIARDGSQEATCPGVARPNRTPAPA
jgi:hypothetical protein